MNHLLIDFLHASSTVWQMLSCVMLEISVLLSSQETLLMDRETARKASRGSTGRSVWVRVSCPCSRLIRAFTIIFHRPKHILGTCKQTLHSSFLHPEVSQIHPSLKTFWWLLCSCLVLYKYWNWSRCACHSHLLCDGCSLCCCRSYLKTLSETFRGSFYTKWLTKEQFSWRGD